MTANMSLNTGVSSQVGDFNINNIGSFGTVNLGQEEPGSTSIVVQNYSLLIIIAAALVVIGIIVLL